MLYHIREKHRNLASVSAAEKENREDQKFKVTYNNDFIRRRMERKALKLQEERLLSKTEGLIDRSGFWL